MQSIEKVKKAIQDLKPVATGNSRNCYHVQDKVVLVESATEQTYENAKHAQHYSNTLHSQGVNTARIDNLYLDDGKLYWVEDKLLGHPVYFRDERSYCMSKGIQRPESLSKLNGKLKDLYALECGIKNKFDIFRLSREEKQQFNLGFEKFKQMKMQDPSLRQQFEYAKQIQDEVVAQNELFAQSYLKADQKHFDKFLQDLVTVCSYDQNIDCHSDNFLYDETAGFSLIDLNIPKEICQQELSSKEFGLVTGFMLDILTRGTTDCETQAGIVEKCLASAQNLGIEISSHNLYIPFHLKQVVGKIEQHQTPCEEGSGQ